jgi:hypothetical protein
MTTRCYSPRLTLRQGRHSPPKMGSHVIQAVSRRPHANVRSPTNKSQPRTHIGGLSELSTKDQALFERTTHGMSEQEMKALFERKTHGMSEQEMKALFERAQGMSEQERKEIGYDRLLKIARGNAENIELEKLQKLRANEELLKSITDSPPQEVKKGVLKKKGFFSLKKKLLILHSSPAVLLYFDIKENLDKNMPPKLIKLHRGCVVKKHMDYDAFVITLPSTYSTYTTVVSPESHYIFAASLNEQTEWIKAIGDVILQAPIDRYYVSALVRAQYLARDRADRNERYLEELERQTMKNLEYYKKRR